MVWHELRTDSFVGYPNSDRLYEPLGSIRVAHIEKLLPYKEGSKEVHFEMKEGDRCWMVLDTVES